MSDDDAIENSAQDFFDRLARRLALAVASIGVRRSI
jgi:hypothetical protein